MRAAAHPFAAPASPARRGCLAALAVAGGLVLACLGAGGFVATTLALAHAPAAYRIAPATTPRLDLSAARRAWGEIRARYRAKDLMVPA